MSTDRDEQNDGCTPEEAPPGARAAGLDEVTWLREVVARRGKQVDDLTSEAVGRRTNILEQNNRIVRLTDAITDLQNTIADRDVQLGSMDVAADMRRASIEELSALLVVRDGQVSRRDTALANADALADQLKVVITELNAKASMLQNANSEWASKCDVLTRRLTSAIAANSALQGTVADRDRAIYDRKAEYNTLAAYNQRLLDTINGRDPLPPVPDLTADMKRLVALGAVGGVDFVAAAKRVRQALDSGARLVEGDDQ